MCSKTDFFLKNSCAMPLMRSVSSIAVQLQLRFYSRADLGGGGGGGGGSFCTILKYQI